MALEVYNKYILLPSSFNCSDISKLSIARLSFQHTLDNGPGVFELTLWLLLILVNADWWENDELVIILQRYVAHYSIFKRTMMCTGQYRSDDSWCIYADVLPWWKMIKMIVRRYLGPHPNITPPSLVARAPPLLLAGFNPKKSWKGAFKSAHFSTSLGIKRSKRPDPNYKTRQEQQLASTWDAPKSRDR